MKYKTTVNNIEVELTEEQIIELHSRLQNKGERYFFPKDGNKFYNLSSYGTDEGYYQSGSAYSNNVVSRGVFKSKEQVKKEDEKRLALVRMWKWVQENGCYFEPEWSISQPKFNVYYHHAYCEWRYSCDDGVHSNFFLPYFKSKSDCQKFIDNNLSDINLFI